MKVIKDIVVFGDSILKGIQINPLNLRYRVDNHIGIDAISKKHAVSIENHSKFGCTISRGYAAIEKWLQKGERCDAIVMDFGGNDCDFVWKEIAERPTEHHEPNTPLSVFADTYRKLIDMLKKSGILPVLTTLPPLAPQKFFDWFMNGLNKENVLKWLGDVNAIYRHQESYSREIEKIALEEDVPLVDLRGEFLKNRQIDQLLCEDGTHPNTEGQKTITSAFLDFAERLSKQRTLARANAANAFA